MKWFAITLLIANVVVFSWQFNAHVRDQTVAAVGVPQLPPGTPSLRLISELAELPPRRANAIDAEGQTDATSQAVEFTTELNNFADPSDHCITVGPIKDEETLEAIKIWLQVAATTMQTTVETIRERRYFWIYLEAVSDIEAEQSISDLKRRGVTDYMLIRRGDLKNAISLGLFRSQDSVNRRLAEMTQQGYKPVVVPKFGTTKHYWIRANLAAGYEDTSNVLEGVPEDLVIEPIGCEEITEDALRAES
ncbi:MAG: hypothetical protein E2O35_04065 [Proteobacteria bacterium]|nr:MAG: hypothetical protein E2O35_04065 [Pseudomonadota bacterium]